MIERAVILSDTDILDIRGVIGATLVQTIEENSSDTSQLPDHNEANREGSHEDKNQGKRGDTFNLELVEQRTVRAALKFHQGNVTKAAKALGLTRGAMYRRLEKYDL